MKKTALLVSVSMLASALLAVVATAAVYLVQRQRIIRAFVCATWGPAGGREHMERIRARALLRRNTQRFSLDADTALLQVRPEKESVDLSTLVMSLMTHACGEALALPSTLTPLAVNSTKSMGVFALGQTVVIVFRGTRSLLEILQDLRVRQAPHPRGGAVHAGFLRLYNSLRPLVQRALEEAAPRTVHIVGHSMGGAMSILCAEELCAGGIVAGGVVQEVKVTLLGTPRMCCPVFAARLRSYFGTLITRWVQFHNEGDFTDTLCTTIMPNFWVPSQPLRYTHVDPAAVVTFHAEEGSWFSNHCVSTYMRHLTNSASSASSASSAAASTAKI